MSPPQPAIPSPFRFITPKRPSQPPPQQQQPQQHRSIAAPTQLRIHKKSSTAELGTRTTKAILDEEIEGHGTDAHDVDDATTHPLVSEGERTGEEVEEEGNTTVTCSATPVRSIGPRSFRLIGPTKHQGLEITEITETLSGIHAYSENTKRLGESEYDALEDPDSPVKKRRRVGGDVPSTVLNELANEDNIEDLRSSSDDEGSEDGNASGLDEDLVLEFIRRRHEMAVGTNAEIHQDAQLVDLGVEKSSLTDVHPTIATIHDDEASQDDNILSSPTPASTNPNPRKANPLMPPPSLPSALRKPRRFIFSPSTPQPPSTSTPTHLSTPTPFYSSPTPTSSIPTTSTTIKPTKPASSYFRTLLAPSHHTHSHQAPNHLVSIPSDWSPSARRSRRNAAGKERSQSSIHPGGGKYVTNGLASTVLSWTLETLSTGKSGEIFGGINHISEGRKCLKITQISGVTSPRCSSDGDSSTGARGERGSGVIRAKEEGVVVKGIDCWVEGSVMIEGDEKKFLLVVGKRGMMMSGIGVERLGVGREVKYGMPWWDVDLGEDKVAKEGAHNEVRTHGKDVYRVLASWEIA